MKFDIEDVLGGKKKDKLMSFEEIGKKLGISKQAAHKIYERAIQKIKDNYKIEYENGKPNWVKKEKPKKDTKTTKSGKPKKYLRKIKKGDKWVYVYPKK